MTTLQVQVLKTHLEELGKDLIAEIKTIEASDGIKDYVIKYIGDSLDLFEENLIPYTVLPFNPFKKIQHIVIDQGDLPRLAISKSLSITETAVQLWLHRNAVKSDYAQFIVNEFNTGALVSLKGTYFLSKEGEVKRVEDVYSYSESNTAIVKFENDTHLISLEDLPSHYYVSINNTKLNELSDMFNSTELLYSQVVTNDNIKRKAP